MRAMPSAGPGWWIGSRHADEPTGPPQGRIPEATGRSYLSAASCSGRTTRGCPAISRSFTTAVERPPCISLHHRALRRFHMLSRCSRASSNTPLPLQPLWAGPGGGPCAPPRSAGPGRLRRAAASRKYCLSSELGEGKSARWCSRASLFAGLPGPSTGGNPRRGRRSRATARACPQGRARKTRHACIQRPSPAEHPCFASSKP